jgi:hypothetical protein
MARVRLVGRVGEKRCAFCHAPVEGAAEVRCRTCRSIAHADCRRELGAGKCATLGCRGEAPRSEGTAGDVGRVETPRRAPLSTARRHSEGAPGRRARLGPYTRLLASGLLWAVVLAASVAGLTYLATHLGEVVNWLAEGTRKHPTTSYVRGWAETVFVSFVAIVLGLTATMRLRQLPAVWREVGVLLDRGEPIPMRLNVQVTGSGKHRKVMAYLRGEGGESLHLELEGVLPAGWVATMPAETIVFVYGYPPPGPYLLEFQDGRLALVHPEF